MAKLNYCYHTHTKRCGHAIGEDEEYVLNAIKYGIKRLGFSDHVFLRDVNQPWMRGKFEWLDEYISSINNLKEKYKDQIEILIGFEAEYLPSHLNDYKDWLINKKIDYLILGQHQGENEDGLTRYFYKNAPKENAYQYAKDVIKGIESGLFKYVCHPDFFFNCYDYWDKDMEKIAKMIIKAAKKHHIPLEVNIGGMNNSHYDPRYLYPTYHFFELAKKYKVDIVVGVDAHDPKDFNEDNINKAFEFIQKLGLDYLIDFKI